MAEPVAATPNGERFNWLERAGDDFPYYRGKPVSITGVQWLLVMFAVIVGLAILLRPPEFLRGPVAGLIPVILLPAIPLAALAWVAPNGWKAIFRKLRFSDLIWMVGFALLSIAATFAIGAILVNLTETTKNAGVAGLAQQTGFEQVMFFIRSLPQLFGEEVFSILPFLAMLWLFTGWGFSRKLAIVLAVVLTAVIFAMAHLETYGWNFVQALGGVGIIRIVLLLPYLMTKNIWVSTGAHVLNDWFSFGLSLVVIGAGAGNDG